MTPSQVKIEKEPSSTGRENFKSKKAPPTAANAEQEAL